MTPARAALACLLSTACAGKASGTDDPTTSTAAATSESPRRPATRACGESSATLPTYAWIPGDARMALSVRLDDAGLDDALAHLGELRDGGDHGLPITLTFVLTQVGLNLQVLRHTFDRAGFAPAELVLVLHDDGTDAWVWHSACDLDAITGRFADTWGLVARKTGGGTVASPSADAPGFPFDVLFLPGELIAFVPAGKAARLQLWLAHGGARVGTPDAPGNPPGKRLAALAPAPIRAVASGKGLLETGEAPDADAAPARAIRATAEGLEIDGRLWRRNHE